MERHYQTTAPLAQGTLGLVGSCASPYFQRASLQKVGPTRDIPILVTMKAIYGLDYLLSSGQGYVGVAFLTGSTVTEVVNIPFDMVDATSEVSIIDNVKTAITAYAATQGYNLSEGWFPVSADPGVPYIWYEGVKEVNAFATVATATVSGGNAVFYLTDTGLSTGTALYSSVYLDSVQIQTFPGAGANVSIGTPTLSTDKKTLTVPCYKQAFSGVVIAGITALGAVTYPAANGSVVKVLVFGT